MKHDKEWFSVSKEGLKELQAGKPKIQILRELIANSFDEVITECNVWIVRQGKSVEISVEDDCPEGFKDITDAYTLFKHTDKRANPKVRGRFNLGEKIAFSVCDSARVETTKGSIVFDKRGRHSYPSMRRSVGSKITVKLKMDKDEEKELYGVENYLPPVKVIFKVNDKVIPYRTPKKVFGTTLMTELEDNGVVKRTSRKTEVQLHVPNEKAYLYELGIPVCVIECDWDIDVQQKVPLSIDRETVLPSFMKDLYAEVLNHAYEDITEKNSSERWVREGMSDERISPVATKSVINKRYGEKAVVADPSDTQSIDRAISEGYHVVRGSEMSKEEWNAVREAEALPSSSKLFRTTFGESIPYSPVTPEMVAVEGLAKKIAKECLDIDIDVRFIKMKHGVCAEYSRKVMVFNVSKLGKNFFSPPLSEYVIDLIVHELGHEQGNHTEENYHRAITGMAGRLTMTALEKPEFFEVGK